MKYWIMSAWIILISLLPVIGWSVDEAAGVKPETTALYREAREQVEKLALTSAAKYAPEAVTQSKQSLAEAQSGLEAGNDTATRDGSERATLQARLALALAEERIAAEKVAAANKELNELNNSLQLILSGKGEQP